MTDTSRFTIAVTGESLNINHQLDYGDMCHISEHASNVRNNILGKLWMILDKDGTITSPILINLIGRSLACKNMFLDTLVVQVIHTIFLNDITVTLIDKTDEKREKSTDFAVIYTIIIQIFTSL